MLAAKPVNELVEASDEQVLTKTIARCGSVDADDYGKVGINALRSRTET